ncbi:MAG: hypothetical protein ACOX8O_01165 [Christensenellales bacterium]
MIHVMTIEDLKYMLSLSKTLRSGYSPAVFPKGPEPSGEGRQASRDALSKLGFVDDAALSAKGRAITDALLAPEKMVQTINAALMDNGPVCYCYKNGFWVIYCPDIQYKLCTVISPVFQAQIEEMARQNLLHGLRLPAFESFGTELTEIEAVILRLTDLVIAKCFEKKEAPLTEDESWFSIDDIYFFRNLADVTAMILPFGEAESKRILGALGDVGMHKQAVRGLVEKGLLECAGSGETFRLRHGAPARKWLLSDQTVDQIALTGIYPPSDSRLYRITRAGILKMTDEGGKIQITSVPDLDYSLFDSGKEPPVSVDASG